MSRTKSHALLALSGFIGLNLLLFGDVLFGSSGQVLSSKDADLYLHFAAWRQFGFEQLKMGHLTLWNPHYLCGNPFLGNFESALLYPPNWLFLFLPLAAALNWGMALHVVLAGFFTYLWAAYRKLHPAAGFLSGVIFMWGGAYYLHLYAGHLPNLCAMVWAPLIFCALDGWVEERKTGWVLLGALSVSMQVLAGHPQYVYLTALAAAFYVLLRLKGNPQPGKSFIGSALFYVGAFFMTAVQSWTGLQALFHSARHSALDPASAGSFSFPPQNLLTLFMPEFFGHLEAGRYWSSWYFWEGSLFIGVTALVLVITAVIQMRERRWLLTMVLASLLLAFGAYTPVYSFLYHWMPFFNGMRGMGKFVFLTSLFLSLLAGMGFDHCLSHTNEGRKKALWVAIISLVFLMLGRFTFGSAMEGASGCWSRNFSLLSWLSSRVSDMDPSLRMGYIQDNGIQSAWSLVEAGCVGLVLAGILFMATIRRKLIYAVVCLAVLESFWFAASNRPVFDMTSFKNKQDRLAQFFIQHPGEDRVYGTGALSLTTHGFDIWEDEPVVPSRYAQFVCYSQGIPENKLYSTSPVFTKLGKTFGLVRLKYLFISDGDDYRVLQIPLHPMPRMTLVSHWTIESNHQAELAAITSNRFDPKEGVVLEKDPALSISSLGGKEGLKWFDHSTDLIEVEATTNHPSVLLVTDNYDPGWKAEALADSGQKKYEAQPGDYFLRAVPLQAGYHHFILKYEPWGFEVGKWVSLLSCFLYVGILLAVHRQNKRSGSSINA
jgi:hypothetical protein